MNAGTGIIGSKHDLNAFSHTTADEQERVCVYCHVPHDAQGSTLSPTALWVTQPNRTFTPYKSETFDANVPNNLVGPTIMCLSCHDGVIASDTHPNLLVDTYGGAGVGVNYDLSNDHPIGIDYLEIVARKSHYKTPYAFWMDGDGLTTIKSVLYDGKYITCATCHDMHNKHNVSDPQNSYNYLVYSRQAKSSLCVSCHDL